MRWIRATLIFSILVTSCGASGCGTSGYGSSDGLGDPTEIASDAGPSAAGDADAGVDVGSTGLPWKAPFFAPAPDRARVLELAVSLLGELRDQVAIRDELAAHIDSMALGGARKAGARAVPPADPDPEPEMMVDPVTEADAWVMAGVTGVLAGSWSTGAWCFAKAVQADPMDPQATNQLGWALLADGRVDAARDVFLFTLETEPRLWTAWSSLAHIYTIEDEPLKAIYYLGRGLQYHPESLHMHLRLGALFLDVGDVRAAALHASQALAIAPQDEGAHALEERVEAAGGEVESPPSQPRVPSSDAMRAVRREYDDCVEDATRWLSETVSSITTEDLARDYDHERHMGDLRGDRADCNGDCDGYPIDAQDSCHRRCDVTYCAAAATAIYTNHLHYMRWVQAELSNAETWRSRVRGCAYYAVELHENELSEADIQDFLLWVSWFVSSDEEAHSDAVDEADRELQDRLAGLGSVCDFPEGTAAVAEAGSAFGDLQLDYGMDVCLDGFVCLSFGDETLGFSLGVNFASGGVTLDYGNPDLIFSLGVGGDALYAAAGVDLKLSIVHGIGVSPNVKFGGVIRSTCSRDFWLFSF